MTTDNLTDARLAEIRLRCEAATKGPWKNDQRIGCVAVYPASEDHECLMDLENDVIHYSCRGAAYIKSRGHWSMDQQAMDDAAFIAHARQDIPDLLAAIRAERKECERLRKEFLKLIERGISHDDLDQLYCCLWCDSANHVGEPIVHDEDCPLRLAADALKGEA